MDTVWLTCPKCSQSFEIDLGFAGAVCRCLQCGSLVSVPATDQGPDQERPVRPQAPKGARFQPSFGPVEPKPTPETVEPEDLPEATIAQPPIDAQPIPAEQTQSPQSQAPPSQPPYDPPAQPYDDSYANAESQPPADNPQPWDSQSQGHQPPATEQWPQQTQNPPPTQADGWSQPPESSAPPQPEQWDEPAPPPVAPTHRPGRTSSHTKSTTAKRRKRNRSGVKKSIVGGFVLLVAMMVAVVIFAVKNSITTTEPASAADNETASVMAGTAPGEGGFDPATTVREAKILSVPTSATTVLVIDAGSSSGSWLPMVKGALTKQLTTQPAQVAIQVVLATEDGPSAFPSQPTASDDIDRAACERFMRSVMALGNPDVLEAVRSACEQSPTQIIMVTGRDFSVDQIRKISKSISQLSDARVDVMAIGVQTSRLAGFARRNHGQYQQLTLDDFQDWFDNLP